MIEAGCRKITDSKKPVQHFFAFFLKKFKAANLIRF
jgi:hypothetical protein